MGKSVFKHVNKMPLWNFNSTYWHLLLIVLFKRRVIIVLLIMHLNVLMGTAWAALQKTFFSKHKKTLKASRMFTLAKIFLLLIESNCFQFLTFWKVTSYRMKQNTCICSSFDFSLTFSFQQKSCISVNLLTALNNENMKTDCQTTQE